MKTFFDESDRLERLSKLGDKLERLNAAVNFEIFRPALEAIWPGTDNRPGGRQRKDRVLMFKILILQKLYNIADDAAEYLINDRLSFQRFLGLELGDLIPDAKTIWLYREELKKSGRYKELFNLFNRALDEAHVITHSGSIVDATITVRPQQRYNKECKDREKRGESEPEETNISKIRQTDTDATYTVKHGKQRFGYKNHVKVDAQSKLIVTEETTTASTNDGTMMEKLVDKKDKKLSGDSAYRGENIKAAVKKKNKKVRITICQKNERNHPMTELQRRNNTLIAKIRCRVEHVFGQMAKAMGGKNLRGVGLDRAKCDNCLKNLAYNLCRWTYLSTQREYYVSWT